MASCGFLESTPLEMHMHHVMNHTLEMTMVVVVLAE